MALAFGAALGNNATFSPGTAVNNRAFTTGTAVPSGGHVIVGAAWYADSNGATYSSLSGGLTWSVDHIATPLVSDTNFTIALFSAPAPSGLASTTTITLTLTANAYGLNLGGIYATGVATSSYEDGTSVATGHTAADGVWGSTITTTNADDLLVGYGYFEGDSITSTPATNYTEALDWAHATTGNSQTMVYRIVSSTGSYTPGGTFSSATTQKMSVAVAYKADTGGGGGGSTPAPQLQFVRSNIRIGP